jgi:hypothetical protein
MHAHHSRIAEHDGEVDRERLHVRAGLGLNVDAQRIEFTSGIRLVKHVRLPVQNECPGTVAAGNYPHRVLARLDCFSLDQHVMAEGYPRRGISSRMPD